MLNPVKSVRPIAVYLPKPGAAVMLGLLVIFAMAVLLDTFGTQFMVSRGIVREGNPLMAALIAKGQFVFFKVTGMLICSGLLWLVYRHFPRLALCSVLGSLAICAAILGWNAYLVSSLPF